MRPLPPILEPPAKPDGWGCSADLDERLLRLGFIIVQHFSRHQIAPQLPVFRKEPPETIAVDAASVTDAPIGQIGSCRSVFDQNAVIDLPPSRCELR